MNNSQLYTSVIDADTLAQHLNDPTWVIIDCRFDLSDPAAGERTYEAAHIPGAVYAHLERDLSAPKDPTGRGGRHPLPTPAEMTAVFGRLGIAPEVQVVTYDDTGGHYAARLWWMLRFMGHQAAAVLDGGWPAWRAAELPVRGGWETPVERLYEGAPHWQMVAAIDEAATAPLLVDARAPERYRGEVEPIDAVAGHIPGAVNRPYAANWTANGLWRSQEGLLADYLELLGHTPAEEAVFYCGSGVSACVNLLGMARAGLPLGRLYVGSWSEWSKLRGI